MFESYSQSDIVPVQLYSIAGHFRISEEDLLVKLRGQFPIAKIGSHFDIPFGGYIGVNESGRFQGQLMDYFGSSSIEGMLDESFISFLKKYHDRKYSIGYHLVGDKKTGFKGVFKPYIDSISVPHEGGAAEAFINQSFTKLPLFAFFANQNDSFTQSS